MSNHQLSRFFQKVQSRKNAALKGTLEPVWSSVFCFLFQIWEKCFLKFLFEISFQNTILPHILFDPYFGKQFSKLKTQNFAKNTVWLHISFSQKSRFTNTSQRYSGILNPSSFSPAWSIHQFFQPFFFPILSAFLYAIHFILIYQKKKKNSIHLVLCMWFKVLI